MKKLYKYVFDVWVHPLKGGDDYETEVKITATSLKSAKIYLEKWLAKRSAVTTDYEFNIREVA